MEQLLELPSVGRKTANCVFVYGFKTPAIPVDTHVHRIFNRIGVVETKTPEDTEKELTRLADRKDWLPLNESERRSVAYLTRPALGRSNDKTSGILFLYRSHHHLGDPLGRPLGSCYRIAWMASLRLDELCVGCIFSTSNVI